MRPVSIAAGTERAPDKSAHTQCVCVGRNGGRPERPQRQLCVARGSSPPAASPLDRKEPAGKAAAAAVRGREREAPRAPPRIAGWSRPGRPRRRPCAAGGARPPPPPPLTCGAGQKSHNSGCARPEARGPRPPPHPAGEPAEEAAEAAACGRRREAPGRLPTLPAGAGMKAQGPSPPPHVAGRSRRKAAEAALPGRGHEACPVGPLPPA
ncbi:basic salivary proline-rich protein 1-like [Sphaerodactylus townsendi]|uniref:basic salivary proline-rich protein 1-like n=1 Tax=Sphaerodactylus townsendi TaxID=933632 RepID=UPI00202714BE|nr:basic salivary proline-rich protein 1-like [Sphaerodactylus townsendi]